MWQNMLTAALGLRRIGAVLQAMNHLLSLKVYTNPLKPCLSAANWESACYTGAAATHRHELRGVTRTLLVHVHAG
jgi:hypothetical protein